MTTTIIARGLDDGRWLRVGIDGPTIASVDPIDGPASVDPEDDRIAPAFWDIQTNGRLGVSFSDADLTVDRVREIVFAQDAIGSSRICPTLITAPADHMRHGVATIASACEADPEVAHRVVGIHLEGPFLCPDDGYRGAHPIEAIRDPDWDLFRSLQDASGGRVVLLTLAPERPGAIDLIERVTASGVVVALGHSAADPETIRRAVDAGARLSTHLGNGIVATLPRHPNPIWTQAADDRLAASLIADGHHLDDDVLRVLVRAKTPARVVLVSDASPMAGLPPGSYGRWAVEPTGRVVVAGTPYLAGANRPLADGVDRLIRSVGLPLAEAIACASTRPALLLGLPEPMVAPGEPADLIRFRIGGDGRFELIDTHVLGRRTPAPADAAIATATATDTPPTDARGRSSRPSATR